MRYATGHNLIIVFIAVFFAISPFKAFADTPIEVFPTIETNGTVSNITVCDGNVYGFANFIGEYPDGSQFQSGNLNNICAVFSGSNLEDGWLNNAGNTEDGEYWSRFTFEGSAFSPSWSGTWYYFRASRIDGLWYPPNTDETTRLVSLLYPTDGQVFDDSTEEIGWSFRLYNGIEPVEVYSLQFVNQTTSETFYATGTTSLGMATYTGTTTVSNGLYKTNLLYSNSTEGYGYGEFDIRSFSVGGTSTDQIFGFDINNPYSLLSSLGYATTTCGITSGEKILGCVIQGGIALFWPNASTTERILSIGTLIQNKPPIGYFFRVRDSLNTLGTSTPPSFELEIPEGVLDTVFNPIKIGLSSILWFFFLVHFYHRVKNIQIW